LINLTITADEAGRRLDRYLKKYLKSAPLSFIYKAIRKDVKVNGKRAGVDLILEAGDEVQLFLSEDKIDEFRQKKEGTKAKKQFEIVYENEQILVVSKPFGLLTHGSKDEKKNTLSNQVISYLIETGSYVPSRNTTWAPAPVNRLDRNTTGLVIFGKTLPALREMTALIRKSPEEGGIEKYYLTVVKGRLRGEIFLDSKMIKDEKTNTIKVLSADATEGLSMKTKVTPLDTGRDYSLVLVKLITGRTHQIRAHLASIGHPVIGDRKYGNPAVNAEMTRRFSLTTQLLHAYRVEIVRAYGVVETLTGKAFKAVPPQDFQEIARSLGLRVNY
jgi:23S rRNA pseudouridine955/2504/2580 synthase